MFSVVITHKQTGRAVVVGRIQIQGMNYTPTAEEYYAQAWKIAVEDGDLGEDAKKDDYNFGLVPVTFHDPLG